MVQVVRYRKWMRMTRLWKCNGDVAHPGVALHGAFNVDNRRDCTGRNTLVKLKAILKQYVKQYVKKVSAFSM